MNKRLFFIFLMIHGIINIKAQKWEPFVKMDNNIFPSFVLATTNMHQNYNYSSNTVYRGDSNSVIGIKITEVPSNTNIRVELSENDLLYKSYIEENLNDPTKTYYIFPKVNYKFDILRNVTQQKPLNIEFKLFIDGNLISTKTITSNIRSLEECPYAMKDVISNNIITTPWMFAAYVNEDSPVINEILSKALKSKIVNQFNGYQGNQANVTNQVLAIWYVLQENGTKYSSITNTSLSSNTVFSQRVRMIEQSYKYSQANCVDGTVLFASILKAIGIDPILIMIPGHMFLGYYIDKNHTKISCLETTLIGKIDLNNLKQNEISNNMLQNIIQINAKIQEVSQFQIGRTPTEKEQQIKSLQELRNKVFDAAKKEASLNSFNYATKIGNEKYNSIISYFGKEYNYQIIDIENSRKLIRPIWR